MTQHVGEARARLPQNVLGQVQAQLGPVTSTALIADGRDARVWRVATPGGHAAVKADQRQGGLVARELAALQLLGERSLAAWGRLDERTWLATTWHAGPTIREQWTTIRDGDSRHPQVRRKALLATFDLCRTLANLHAAGWTHAILTPEHCIHTRHGVRLVSYTRASGPRGRAAEALDGAIPRHGVPTELAAPEICAARLAGDVPPATSESEVYTLAATLWWCWTGRYPVDYGAVGASVDDPVDVRRRLVADGLPFPGIPANCSWPRLEIRLKAALSRDPSARPTAAQLARVIDRL